ncbi:MAG: hypothetical protein FIB06_00250 [Betaproteobacteria bacterium]|nr:hypothetical protein [Betaproteobacteria bacterium]
MPAPLWMLVHAGAILPAGLFAALDWPPGKDLWQYVALGLLAVTAFVAGLNWVRHPLPPVLVRADGNGLRLRYRFAERYLDVPWAGVGAIRAQRVTNTPCLLIELTDELPHDLRQAMALFDNGPPSPVVYAGQGRRLTALQQLAMRMEALRPAGT